MKKIATVLCLVLGWTINLFGQTTTLSGNIRSSKGNENIPAVSIIVKGSNAGTFTDDKGNFRLTGNLTYPITLVISSIGYATKEVVITDASVSLKITLDPMVALAQDVVISASRFPERILESPVTIERIGAGAIRNNASTNYYDLVGGLKGVDVIASSLIFKTPTTRGFSGSGNLRLNQLVDGMDNQAPGLNFAVGTMVGPSELDVENVELLGGASSALYGPGGMNGTLLINSKNPFKYQGLSAQVKEGIMHIADDARKSSAYNDIDLRYAKAVSDKFAFKVAGHYTYAKDWVAQDYRDFNRGTNPAKGNVQPGDRSTDPNYNGVNVYGDESTGDIRPVFQQIIALNPQAAPVLQPYLLAPMNVSRTGYQERDIIDPTTKNLRLSGSLNYMITPGIEASFMGYWGSGTTVYTGSDRYSLKDFKIGQYKLELRNKNWFFRAYTTQEDAGKSFNATVTTQLYNESWKPSLDTTSFTSLLGSWFPQYGQAFTQAASTVFQQAFTAALQAGQTQQQAAATAQAAVVANTASFHNIARSFADQGMPAIGSAEFRRRFDSVAARSISNGGGLFVDKSSLYMTEGQYNFSNLVKVVELLVGANYKQYVLNSEGTLFADSAGRIKINEVGAYLLVSKKLFKDILKLTASGRYDKNTNFKGRFTPRFSAVVSVAKDHNIRLSYQTAYRFPSTQNQWIDLQVGGGVTLIGGLPQLRHYYGLDANPGYTPESIQAGNPKVFNFGDYKPEQSVSYEVGYKGLIKNKLLIDVYGYYTKYENFISRQTVVQSPGTPNQKIFSVSVNSPEKVNSQGWALSLEYLLPRNFSINGNVYSDEIKNVPAGFVTYYNTPKYRTNVGLNNSGILFKKRLGFSLQYRYQDAYDTQTDFISGRTPAFNTLDAQLNYRIPNIKSIIKIGGTNITNHYYTTAIANPYIGAVYYAGFAYNVF